MQTNFRSSRSKKKLIAEVNAVPYIDITFVLLLVFMITAPALQQAITVNLPQTPTIALEEVVAPAEPPFIITVTKEGLYKTSANPTVMLGQKDLDTLVARTVARVSLNPNMKIHIGADKEAAYGKVVNLFVRLKYNGIEQVSLLTKPVEF